MASKSRLIVKEINRCLTSLRYSIVTEKAKDESYRDFPDLAETRDPFFVIGIPGSLHLVELCLKYVPPNIDIIFIANGLDKFEQEWAKQHFNVYAIVKVSKLLKHGDILDMILAKYRRNFGILDYDCFVFDSSLFNKLKNIGSNTLFSSLYVYQNKMLKLNYPETFLLFLNAELLNEIRQNNGVSCKPYNVWGVSRKIWLQLGKIGIDQKHLPEGYKPIFDTLRLLISLGYAAGYKPNFIEEFTSDHQPKDRIYHVGGVSRIVIPKTKWAARGVYLWRRALEKNGNDELRKQYQKKYGDLTAADFRMQNTALAKRIGDEYFNFVEKIIQVNSKKN